MVTEETFENYDSGLHYCYAWTNEEKDLSEKEKKEFSEDILECLTEHTVVTDFVKRADNQAIMFTGDDMGSDKAMMTWMLYVVIAVLAFVFAVTTNSTIEKEATVIGTCLLYTSSKVEYIVAHGIVSYINGERAVIGSSHFVFEDEKCLVLEEEKEKFDSIPEEYSHLYLSLIHI